MGMHQQQPPPEDGTDDHDAFNDITFLGGTSGDGSGGDLSSSLGGIIEVQCTSQLQGSAEELSCSWRHAVVGCVEACGSVV